MFVWLVTLGVQGLVGLAVFKVLVMCLSVGGCLAIVYGIVINYITKGEQVFIECGVWLECCPCCFGLLV